MKTPTTPQTSPIDQRITALQEQSGTSPHTIPAICHTTDMLRNAVVVARTVFGDRPDPELVLEVYDRLQDEWIRRAEEEMDEDSEEDDMVDSGSKQSTTPP